jgi:hypothetical protein
VNRLTAADRVAWSFWAAGGIAFVGGLLPLLVGGTSSRVATVAIPFTIAAAAFVGCGFVHEQGRGVTAILYFVAGLAIVYGLLAMFSVPLQLAALGSCPAPPAPCTGGLGRPLTLGENTGMGFGTGFGVAALFVGFFGLMVVFRRTVVAAPTPPVRKIPPVTPPAEKPATAAVAAKPETEPELEPEPEAEPELPAHEEEELPELPAHESESSN